MSTLICPECLNPEVTCGVRIITTTWRGGAKMHQCLLCAGAYKVVIVKRHDPEVGMTYVSDLSSQKAWDKRKGWFLGDEGEDHAVGVLA